MNMIVNLVSISKILVASSIIATVIISPSCGHRLAESSYEELIRLAETRLAQNS